MADEKTEEKVEEAVPEPIKLGEKEYSQEDLQRLVGLGEQATELESRWDTKLDRLMPEYSKSREELKTLKEQAEIKAEAIIEKKEAAGEELGEAEKAKIVRDELKKHKVVFEDDLENYYQNRRGGEQFLERTESVITKAATEEKPKVTAENLLTFMKERGIAQPEDAYELMFKTELRNIEMKKLQGIKPAGIDTGTGSTAGAKIPQSVTVTKDNLSDMLGEVLNRGGGQ